KRHGVLALIPGPDLASERVSGGLGGGGGRPGGAAGKREQDERNESEPGHSFHAAASLTNAVPANGDDLSRPCGRRAAARMEEFSTFVDAAGARGYGMARGRRQAGGRDGRH